MPLRRKNRTPHSQCPLSDCMAHIGGAWSPNILWPLASQPRRISEIRSDIPPVSAKVLTQRLRELEGRGILTRNVTKATPLGVEYVLTAFRQKFLPVLHAIVEVSQRLRDRSTAT